MGLRQQILKNNGGQLSATSGEELNSIAASRERAVPTNPLEAFNMTSNEDSAKMAGTAANKMNAIRQSINQSLNQQTNQRQRQDYQGEADAQKKTQLGGLELAGQLEGRVPQLAQQMFQGGTAQLSGNSGALNQKLTTQDAGEKAAAQAALDKISKGQATPQDFAALAKAMGKLTVTQEDLSGLLNGSPEAITAAIQQATPDSALVSQLYNPEELTQLGGTLGLGDEDMALLTVKQLQDKVKEFNRQEMSETAKLQAMANSPDASPAERAQARRLLAETGASGERVIEQEAKTLEQQIQDGDKLTFMGQEMSIEDALSDENISGAVKRYFEEPGFKEKLLQSEPQLANLIAKNEKDFANAVQGINDSAANYNKIQEENQAIKNLPDGMSISDSVMKQLIPGWGTASAEKFQVPPFVEALKSGGMTGPQRNALVQRMTSLAKQPALLNDLKTMSYDELNQFGLIQNPELLDRVAHSVEIRDSFANKDVASNPEEFLMATFGKGQAELDNIIPDLRAAATFSGNAEAKRVLEMLDSDGDGKVDTGAIKGRALDIIGSGNLKDLLKRSTPEGIFQGGQNALNDAKNNSLFGVLKDGMRDGTLDYNEAKAAVTNNPSLIDAMWQNKMTLPATVRHAIENRQTEIARDVYGLDSKSKNWGMRDLFFNKPMRGDSVGSMQNYVKELEQQKAGQPAPYAQKYDEAINKANTEIARLSKLNSVIANGESLGKGQSSMWLKEKGYSPALATEAKKYFNETGKLLPAYEAYLKKIKFI